MLEFGHRVIVRLKPDEKFAFFLSPDEGRTLLADIYFCPWCGKELSGQHPRDREIV